MGATRICPEPVSDTRPAHATVNTHSDLTALFMTKAIISSGPMLQETQPQPELQLTRRAFTSDEMVYFFRISS
jgi:hypothetical protein